VTRSEAFDELLDIVDTLCVSKSEEEADAILQRVYQLCDQMDRPKLQEVSGKVLSFADHVRLKERFRQ
jgi:hypothetical protein